MKVIRLYIRVECTCRIVFFAYLVTFRLSAPLDSILVSGKCPVEEYAIRGPRSSPQVIVKVHQNWFLVLFYRRNGQTYLPVKIPGSRASGSLGRDI